MKKVKLLRSPGKWARFWGDYARYAKSAGGGPFPASLADAYPILSDWSKKAGSTGGHYFLQDLWMARRIFAARPQRHVDIGSRIDGFVAHLLVFMPVELVDIRPLPSTVGGLSFTQDDATRLGTFADNSVESLSSLHAAEHFGLGRYGDPVDPQACFKFMNALARVLAPGGRLYFSVPVGRQRVEFNAHRVFAPRTVLDSFPTLELRAFAAIDDAGVLREQARPDDVAGADFACGLFEFGKRG